MKRGTFIHFFRSLALGCDNPDGLEAKYLPIRVVVTTNTFPGLRNVPAKKQNQGRCSPKVSFVVQSCMTVINSNLDLSRLNGIRRSQDSRQATVETTVPTLTTVPASHGPTTHLNAAFHHPVLIISPVIAC
ncbi:hypothetical protein FPOAC2_12898 [Fusarium poae]